MIERGEEILPWVPPPPPPPPRAPALSGRLPRRVSGVGEGDTQSSQGRGSGILFSDYLRFSGELEYLTGYPTYH